MAPWGRKGDRIDFGVMFSFGWVLSAGLPLSYTIVQIRWVEIKCCCGNGHKTLSRSGRDQKTVSAQNLTYWGTGFCYSEGASVKDSELVCSLSSVKSLCSLMAIMRTSLITLMADTALECNCCRLGRGASLPCPL